MNQHVNTLLQQRATELAADPETTPQQVAGLIAAMLEAMRPPTQPQNPMAQAMEAHRRMYEKPGGGQRNAE